MSFDMFALILIGLGFAIKFLLLGLVILIGIRVLTAILSAIFGPRNNSVNINININQEPQQPPHKPDQVPHEVPSWAPNWTSPPPRQAVDPTRTEIESPRREPPPLLKGPLVKEPLTIDHAPSRQRKLPYYPS